MPQGKIKRTAKEYRRRSPIDIPDNATYKAKSKNGYEQITYKWSDGDYKYESRWHIRTPGAPEGQGSTWVVTRKKPGNGREKPIIEFFIKDKWVPAYEWHQAIAARKKGTATKIQLDLLEQGHWRDE